MRERGISTVIATVLTVLITVAAVSILWTAVQPILSRADTTANPHLHFDIEKKGSFTFYDPETGYLSVRVSRGSDTDDPRVVALLFVMDIGDTTVSRKTYNVMPPNHALVYYFLVGFDVDLSSVKVAPVFIVNGEERQGESFDIEARIPHGPGRLRDKVGEVPIVPDLNNPVTDGLVMYYSFDAEFGNGTHIIDQSGKGHTGELFGDAALLQGGGREFATFDGAGDYILLAEGEGLSDATQGDKTITFWANFDCPIDVVNINQVPIGSYENYYIGFVDPCNNFVNAELRVNYDLPPANPRTYTSENIWNDLTGWEFFTVVLDQTENVIRVYRAGQKVDMQTGLVLGSSLPNPNFYVGTVADVDGSPTASSYFRGGLDDLRVYNRALSGEEIQELYEFAA